VRFRRFQRAGLLPAAEDRWWEQPVPSTVDELLQQLGLKALIGTDLEDLAALLDRSRSLLPRETAVLRLRLGLDQGGKPRSVPEVTSELGVAETRIHQVAMEAATKLRDELGPGC
jgi:DNA-directed RNA polymerase sigma subunit (sigma70/sigma32)